MAPLTSDGLHSRNIFIAFLVLATTSVLGRFVVRLKKKAAPLTSDYVLFVGLAIYVAFSAILFRVLDIGGTLNATVYPVPVLLQAYKLDYSLEYLLTGGIAFAKISLLLFYMIIFTHRDFRRLAILGISLVVAWLVAITLVIAFQCTPFNAAYDPTVELTQPTKCLTFGNLVLGANVSNIVTDIYIIVLPVREVLKLQMKTGRKAGLAAIFAFGIFTIATGIVRIVIATNYSIAGSGTPDLPKVLEWSSIELGCCIICAAVPGLPPLLPEATFWSSLASTFRSWATSTRGKQSTRDNSDASLVHHKREKERDSLPLHKMSTVSVAEHSRTPPRILHDDAVHVSKNISVEREARF